MSGESTVHYQCVEMQHAPTDRHHPCVTMQRSLARMQRKAHLGTILLTMIARGTRRTVVEIIPNTSGRIGREVTGCVHGTDGYGGNEGRGGVRNSVTRTSDSIFDSTRLSRSVDVLQANVISHVM